MDGNSKSVAAFRIDAVTGILSPISGSPFSMGGAGSTIILTSMVFTKSGKFAYVGDGRANFVSSSLAFEPADIYGFTVDQNTGALTAITGLPVTTGGVKPANLQVYPDDNYLIVTNLGAVNGGSTICYSQCTPSVAIFGINANSGALTAAVGSPFATPGTTPGAVVLDVSGKFAYLTDNASNTVTAFSVNASNGTITVVGTYPTGTSPSSLPTIFGQQ